MRVAGRALVLALLAAAVATCGDDEDDAVIPALLIVSPAGPTVLEKDGALQFTATESGVTWSVDGGDANGRIDANGLFVHPDSLPANHRVTVRAETPDGRSATAVVDLHTAATIAFGTAQTLNAAPIPGVIFEASLSLAGVGDGVAVGVNGGSVHVDALWGMLNGSTINAYFAQEVDLNGFAGERNLVPTTDPGSLIYAQGVDVDSSLNPGVLLSASDNGLLRVFFLGSSDGGASFASPIPVNDFIGAQSQFQAALVYDDSDAVHVTYVTNDGTPTPEGSVVYGRSGNGGMTWSAPVAIDAQTPQCFPQIATDAEGETVLVCYERGSCGTGTVMLARSGDGGTSFASPVVVATATPAGFCQVRRSDDGRVFVSFQQGGDVIVATSSDDGETIPGHTKVNTTATHLAGGTGLGPLPHLSVDRLGRIDVVWSVDTNGDNNADALRFARSTDGGATFSNEQTIATTNGILLSALGLRHDDAGRCHLLYATDSGVRGQYNVRYARAE